MSPVFAGEKKLLHCFYFTAVEGATEPEWQAFFKASDDLPGKIPGLSKAWYGKLERPMTLFSTDEETRKKLGAGEQASGPVTRTVRQWGMCMEFADAAALKAYGPNPAHKAWEEAYSKVRVYGTTTVNFQGQ